MAIDSPPLPASVPASEIHELLDAVLDAAVRHATGDPGAVARPGQRRLAHDIARVDARRYRPGRRGPTGSGKSLAALSPALLLAAVRGERSVISTETLGLQEHYIGKDVPVVRSALADVLDRPLTEVPSVAVLKGWANSVCSAATVTLADEIAGPLDGIEAAISALDGLEVPDATETSRLALARWALAEIAGDRPGDRGSYPEVLASGYWESVSVSPAECPGTTRCRYGSTCRPAKAREVAAAAEVIITNHSMLATQAAKAIPVVVGNETIGEIDHLVVDEAHALASKVRDQGSTQINAYRVSEVARSVGRAVVETSRSKVVLGDEASQVGTALDSHLAATLPARPSASRPAIFEVPADADPLEGVGELVESWIGRVRRLMPRRARGAGDGEAMIKLWRAQAKLDALVSDLTASRQAVGGVARWVEAGRGGSGGWSGATLKLSPVNAAGPLRANLYGSRVTANSGDLDDPDDADMGRPAVSVALMSATLPAASVADAGVATSTRKVYPSPFTEAYSRSWLYVPRPDAGGGGAGVLRREGGKGFDTSAHPAWAVSLITRLGEANRGSALVLAATTAAGKLYTEALRSHAGAGWDVHSQWDGLALRATVEAWRTDHASVLVGTKSLMTGVDAPGGTCSLVIVDRVPRAAGNPVDDARVADIVERLGIERYSADRLVYVADAALLLEQAAGRLIRATTDGGIVAVLDPRLLRVGGLSYP